MPSVAPSPLSPTLTVTVLSSANVLLFEKVAVTVTTVAPDPSLTLGGFTLRFRLTVSAAALAERMIMEMIATSRAVTLREGGMRPALTTRRMEDAVMAVKFMVWS